MSQQKQFLVLNNILSRSFFLPDTMQEFCRKERYEFSKFYLNKFALLTGCANFSVFSSYINPWLINYFMEAGLIKRKNFYLVKGDNDLHNILLTDIFGKKIIKNSKCTYLFPYKEGVKTKQLAKKLNLTLVNHYRNVKYLSDKKNLYKIFPYQYLPLLYNLSSFPENNNLSIVIKPRIGANSRGILVVPSGLIKKYIKGDIKLKNFLLQEYVSGTICHSITFLNHNGQIDILYTAQQTIKKIPIDRFSFGFSIEEIVISSLYNKKYSTYYEKVLSLVREQQSYFLGVKVFVIEFIITKEGTVKIMEINPRIGASIVMANFLYWQSNISQYQDFYLSNKSYNINQEFSIMQRLIEKGWLFSGSNIPSALPINLSTEFGILDVIIIGKNKEEHDTIHNFINGITS